MEQRPVGLVAAPVIVEVKECGVDINRERLTREQAGGRGLVVGLRFRDPLDLVVEVVQPGPPDPDAIIVDDNRSYGSDESSSAIIKR